jgi:apolipoprotein N-acyltransferase
MSERLKSLNLEELSQKYKKIFLIGPETTYPYTFNDKKWLVKRWGELLPDNVHMIFGSGLLNKIRKKTYQTVYWTKESLIMQHYDKTHRVAFTEKIPRFIKKYKRTRVGAWLYKLFEGRAFIGKGRNRPENEIFCLDNDLVIKPILCSELFMKNISKATRNYHLMVAFLNDNWFCGYFRNILLKLARLRGIFFERPLIYVGHA